MTGKGAPNNRLAEEQKQLVENIPSKIRESGNAGQPKVLVGGSDHNIMNRRHRLIKDPQTTKWPQVLRRGNEPRNKGDINGIQSNKVQIYGHLPIGCSKSVQGPCSKRFMLKHLVLR
jgi:hypothetical protein